MKFLKSKLKIFLILGSLIFTITNTFGKTVSLVVNGKPTAVLLLSSKPQPDEILAAREIADHIKKISGAKLLISRGGKAPAGMISVEIGLNLNPEVKTEILKKGTDSDSLILDVRLKKIIVAGLSQQGTLFAAYELLTQLGCRWFIPGETGIVVPKKKTITLEVGKTIQIPSFKGRHLQAAGDRTWKRRNRMGGINPGGHGMHFSPNPKTHPEYYCTENGKTTGMLKLWNPVVMENLIAVAKAYMKRYPKTQYIPMGPPDGTGFGTSPWDADDLDPFHGKISVTDRYVKCFNIILKELQKDYPDVGVAFYAYSQYTRPPVREKPNQKILPVLAPIDVCRLHSIDNPACKERSYLRELVSGWQKLGVKLFYRGYLFNLADQGLPFSMFSQVSSEIPFYHKQGFIGCRIECNPMWAHHGPSLYLAAKLFWDVNVPPQTVLDDFFNKFYGSAALTVKRYFDTLEKAYYNADYHAGNIYDLPNILTPEVMNELDDLLKKAQKKVVPGSIYAKRLAMLVLAHAYGQDNLDMLAQLYAFHFKEAMAAYKRALEKIEQGKKFDPSPINVRFGKAYLKRFWFDTLKSGLERCSDGNEIAAQMPDEWLFIQDPKSIGEKQGYMKPEYSTKGWRRLKTYSQTWSSQGLRYYRNDAWYRTKVKVPAKFKNRKMKLWFGGIDDKAEVWINSKKLKCITKGAAPSGRHWEFAATPAIKFGAVNTIAVKVSNHVHNELGMGGITQPAMLWAEK